MDRIEPLLDNRAYHLYNRGNNQQTIFHCSVDYEAFLQKLDRGATEYGVALLAFVLMPNHYHLLGLQKPGGSIPEMMNALGTSSARRYNFKYSHTGHVFQGPYRRSLITTDEGVADAARYIHLNPVRAGLSRLPEEWPYSSYPLLVGCPTSRGMRNHFSFGAHDPQRLLALFGGDVRRYVEFVGETVAFEEQIGKLLFEGGASS